MHDKQKMFNDYYAVILYAQNVRAKLVTSTTNLKSECTHSTFVFNCY